jgi:HEAT repeat protein
VRDLFDDVSEATSRYPDAWSKTSDEEPDLKRIRTLFRIRNKALDVMADFRDPYAVDAVMKGIEKEDGGTQIWMARYLEKVGPLRPEIKPKLEEMLTSKTSQLRNHDILIRAVEAIDKAEAKKPDDDGSNANEDSDDPDDD